MIIRCLHQLCRDLKSHYQEAAHSVWDFTFNDEPENTNIDVNAADPRYQVLQRICHCITRERWCSALLFRVNYILEARTDLVERMMFGCKLRVIAMARIRPPRIRSLMAVPSTHPRCIKEPFRKPRLAQEQTRRRAELRLFQEQTRNTPAPDIAVFVSIWIQGRERVGKACKDASQG